MNKPELLKKIKDLQGLTNDEKVILINLVNTKKYGLVWEDKPEDVVEELLTKLPVLIEDKGKFIEGQQEQAKQDLFKGETKQPKAPNHILIEGDNLHALTALTFTHEGKIDIIYIDPPYNTGARDWRYNNDYVDNEDAYRHSKWLSFMKNRLCISKPLLKKDGILIVTIDDNELFHLGNLLEELFPSYQQFIITIEHNKRGRRGKNFAKTNEWAIFLIPKGMELVLEEQSETTIGGETRNLRRTGSGSKRTDRPRKFYPIWVNKDTLEVVKAGDPIPIDAEWQSETKGDLISIWPLDEDGREKNWHYGVDRTRKCIEDEVLEARKRDYGIQVYYTLREKDSKKYKTVWTGAKYDASSHGSVLLEAILGEPGKFDYPKSLYAVLECFQATIRNRKNAIILDFFAGSGTTGHAVLELNKEDEGSRQFILVTNNENNICEEVTYERNKRVISGYTKPNGEKVEGLTNNNLRYYKTSFVGREKTTANKKELTQLATELLCIKEDIYEELKAPKNIRLFQNGTINLMVIYDDNAIPKAVEIISGFPEKSLTKVYVFSEGQDPYTEDFSEVADKVSLCALPDAIYKAYQFVLPKKSRKGIPHIEEVIPAATNESGQLIFETQN